MNRITGAERQYVVFGVTESKADYRGTDADKETNFGMGSFFGNSVN